MGDVMARTSAKGRLRDHYAGVIRAMIEGEARKIFAQPNLDARECAEQLRRADALVEAAALEAGRISAVTSYMGDVGQWMVDGAGRGHRERMKRLAVAKRRSKACGT